MVSLTANIPEIIDNLPGGVVAVTADKSGLRGVYANAVLPEILGCSLDEYARWLPEHPLGWILAEDSHELNAFLKSGSREKCDCRSVKADGEMLWLRISAAPAGRMQDSPLYYLWVTDVTDEREAEQKRAQIEAELQFRAERDTLTGVYNRATFGDMTLRMLRDNPEEKFVLIRCDIARFKLINDLLGRGVGDRVLRRLAETLTHAVGENGTCGRLEADHFVICVPKVLAFIDVLQHKINSGMERENIEGGVIVNFGVYEIDDPDIPVEQMCDRANMALQTIKGNYLQRFAYYDEILRHNLLQEQEIISTMHAALEGRQFKVYLQPIYGVAARKPISAEALVRWQHPHRGIMAPSVFIPLFERNGFIAKLDYFVWEEVCKFQRARLDAGAEVIPISVNVSRLNLHNPHLASDISALVAKHNISPTLLPLEITESAYSDSPAQLRKTVIALRDSGFAVYMDDFGSGYSSLNVLKDIPFDVIKMDTEFLRDLETSENAGNIVTSIVRMARWLGKPVIAEGVETAEQMRFLRSIGCERIQGFYFSKPITLDGLSAMLDDNDQEKWCVGERYPRGWVTSDRDFDDLFEGDGLVHRLFNSIIGGVGIYELTSERLEVVRVNDGYYEMMGYNPRSFYDDSENIFSRVVEEDRETLYEACRRAVDGKDDKAVIIRRMRANGSIALLNAHVRYIGERGGNPLLCLAFNDITGKRSNELIVQQQRKTLSQYFRFLDTLYRTMPCGIVQYSFTEHPQLVSANQTACTLYGFPDEENLKKSHDTAPFSWIFPADREYVLSGLRDFLRNPRKLPYEHRVRRPDGNVAWVKGTLDKVVNVNGKELIQSVFLDVTEEKDEKRTLQLIMENLPVGVGIFEVRETLTPLYLSEQVWEIFGITHEEYLELQKRGESFAFMPPVKDFSLQKLQDCNDELPFEIEFQAKKYQGAALWLRAVGQARLNDNGRVIVYTSLADITGRIVEERQMAKQNELYKLLIEDSQMVIYDYDIENDTMNYSIMLPNKRRENRSVSGYCRDFAAGRYMHPDFHQEFRELMLRAMEKVQDGVFEYKADYFGKGFAWYRCIYRSLADNAGYVFRFVARAYDISEEIAATNALRAKAATDAMSGLYNRAMTEELIDNKLAQLPEGVAYALLIIDIDHFKKINDTLGHLIGDKVIHAFGEVLRSQFRADDIVGRIGGDEFAVLVQTAPEGVQIETRLRAVLAAVRNLSAALALGVDFSASIGVAYAPENGDTFAAVFSKADAALYQVKQNGRDGAVISASGNTSAGIIR